jgi:hypothetical protein
MKKKMTELSRPRMIRVTRWLLLGLVVAMLESSAFADSIFDSLSVGVNTLLCSFSGQCTWRQEAATAREELLKEYNEQFANKELFVGGISLNGSAGVYSFGSGSGTLTANFTFAWVNPATGLPTSGPAIGSVQYYVWNGAVTSLNLSAWTLVGTSSNSASGFEFTYSFPAGEHIFLSVPLNSSGQPIFINGVGGFNDAESIVMNTITPEPGSLVLLGTGALALAPVMRKRIANGIRPGTRTLRC